MLDYLFERRPEYDENGNVVSHTVPRIAWVIMVGLLFFCFKDKVMKQGGGATPLPFSNRHNVQQAVSRAISSHANASKEKRNRYIVILVVIAIIGAAFILGIVLEHRNKLLSMI